ncbi:uncharacterized protein LOC132061602 [Lycium ferocissimum]|uniref:uncharacterized protein LOC132061602 n=1 Tax=Lycium ferocissimum TaxID=112874 RepID=UPI002816328C|nr:uncharacterized protein LOC132061602 [Lycium ferocissimum]
MAEVLAVEIGIAWCKDNGYKKLEIEVDSQQLVEWLQDTAKEPWRVWNFIKHSKEILEQMEEWSIKHCFREGNKVADGLANWALRCNDTTWISQFHLLPKEIRGAPNMDKLNFPSFRTKNVRNAFELKHYNNFTPPPKVDLPPASPPPKPTSSSPSPPKVDPLPDAPPPQQNNPPSSPSPPPIVHPPPVSPSPPAQNPDPSPPPQSGSSPPPPSPVNSPPQSASVPPQGSPPTPPSDPPNNSARLLLPPTNSPPLPSFPPLRDSPPTPSLGPPNNSPPSPPVPSGGTTTNSSSNSADSTNRL